MWEDQKSQEIKGGSKDNMRLISVREIRSEPTSDYIAVPCRGIGRSGRKRLLLPGSPGWLAAVLHTENQQSCSLKFKINKGSSHKSK